MSPIRLVRHSLGPPGLRWLGVGPDLRPCRAFVKLPRLLGRCAFWARGRSFTQLRRILVGIDAVVSVWSDKRLEGFGRASSDGYSLAVLLDVVKAGDLQGHGLGRRVVEELPATGVSGLESVHIMSTNSGGFYRQLGCCDAIPQQLLVVKGRENGSNVTA